MTERLEFPPVHLLRVEVEQSPRWGAMRELVPLFDRAPYGDWCHFFRMTCEEAQDVDWKGAGFVLCGQDEVDATTERLRDITAAANSKFVDFIERARVSQPEQAEELLTLENINAASLSDDGGYLCNWNAR